MYNFGVLDNNNEIINIIVSETLETAEQISGSTCVQIKDEDGVIIGNTYDINTQRVIKDKKPYDSWVLLNGEWSAPINKPTDGKNYKWDEESKTWVDNPKFPSWTWSSEENKYLPPVPYPGDATTLYEWIEEIKNWQLLHQPKHPIATVDENGKKTIVYFVDETGNVLPIDEWDGKQ